MKKFFSSLFILSLLLGCAVMPGDEPSKKETGSVSIALPANSRAVTDSITTYTINIKGTTIDYTKDLTATPGETVKIEELAPESYTITVKGYDASSVEIVKGTSEVTVVANTVTPVVIELGYSVSGEVSIELILPGITNDARTYRTTRDGHNHYSYDADGVITQIVNTTNWNPHREDFTISGGKRTGSKVYKYDKVTKTYEATNSSYSVIQQDAGNTYEQTITYYDTATNDPIDEYVIMYLSNGREVTYHRWEDDGTETGTIVKNRKNVRIYDVDGKMASEEHFMGSTFWTWFMGVGLDFGFGEPVTVSSIRAVYEYYPHPNTHQRTKETVYVDGELEFETTITMRDPGVNQHGAVRNANGNVIAEIHFGELYKYNNKYAQSVDADFNTNTENLALNGSGKYTVLYDENLIGCGTIAFPYEKELGSAAPGQFTRGW